MHVLLLVTKTGQHEWYPYKDKKELMEAKKAWEQQSRFSIVLPVFTTTLTPKPKP